MKFARHIFSIGMHHQVKNSIKHQENMLKIFICLIPEEVIDAFLIGVFKVEFHSLIHKLLKRIGHYLLNGVVLNIKELKSGG